MGAVEASDSPNRRGYADRAAYRLVDGVDTRHRILVHAVELLSIGGFGQYRGYGASRQRNHVAHHIARGVDHRDIRSGAGCTARWSSATIGYVYVGRFCGMNEYRIGT